jgi:hypothetical protein
MPLVGAGDDRVDELRSLNEYPGKHIGDYYREALPLLDQAALPPSRPSRCSSPGESFLAGWIGIASTRSIAVIKCGCIVSCSRSCTAASETSCTAASGTSGTGGPWYHTDALSRSFNSGSSDTGGDGLLPSFTTAAPATR